MDDESLYSLRYIFQRILVPCVVIVGVLGNFASVIVLTRRRMRCSTNIYLTALAVTDIVYLMFVFILSLQHYPNINRAKYGIYWQTIGLSHWLNDAAAYSSIYLTVSFTIERYIAVCHPIRGQFLCTESRAKKVIAAVIILCMLATVTTSFEYQLTTVAKFEDKITNKECIPAVGNTSNIISTVKSQNNLAPELNGEMVFAPPTITTPSTASLLTSSFQSLNQNFSVNCTCQETFYLYAVPSPFGLNKTYRAIFYRFTCVAFIFLPLVLLATFNCFLVAAVRKSLVMRHKLTNHIQHNDAATPHEHKITVTLIAVVVLFLVCQAPTAVFLIYDSLPRTPLDHASNNLLLALGTIMEFLVTINAASNFLLYCALSDKYRQTVRTLIFGRHTVGRRGGHHQHNQPPSSRVSWSTSRGGGIGRDRGSFYSTYDRGSFTRGRRTNEASVTPRVSLTPSEFARFDQSMKGSSAASINCQHYPVDVACMAAYSNGNNSSRFLKPNGIHLESLPRTQSLILRPTTRHSPDCRCNPNKF